MVAKVAVLLQGVQVGEKVGDIVYPIEGGHLACVLGVCWDVVYTDLQILNYHVVAKNSVRLSKQLSPIQESLSHIVIVPNTLCDIISVRSS